MRRLTSTGMNISGRTAAFWSSSWLVLAGATLLSWAILGIGFRILYDSVIPEVVLVVLSGFVLGMTNRPTRACTALAGLVIGMVLSEKVFPAPVPAAHRARYGPPHPPSWKDFALISAFPALGIVAGALVRVFGRLALRSDG